MQNAMDLADHNSHDAVMLDLVAQLETAIASMGPLTSSARDKSPCSRSLGAPPGAIIGSSRAAALSVRGGQLIDSVEGSRLVITAFGNREQNS